MLERGAEQLVLKLEQLFQGKEEHIANGRLNVCLTASVIVFLNTCFEDAEQHTSSQNRRIEYLKECVQIIHTLKIVPGPSYNFRSIIDISPFKAVKVLQIEKIAIGYVSGLRTLRSSIKVLKSSRSIDKINDVLILCGHDSSTALIAWPYLEVADFSFNTIRSLDSSLYLLSSVRSLNLSNNELTNVNGEEGEEEDKEQWMYLPEVSKLDLGCNRLTKVPSFPENCCLNITTLILRNNDLVSLAGLETLPNLETLDVSANCISSFFSFSSLVHLHRLISICCYGNPIFYDKRYRSTIVSCLSPSPRRRSIVLDRKEISVKELYNLGLSLEVDLSSYIPARPNGTPVHMIHNNFAEALVSSGEFFAPRTPEEKRKIRQPAIVNADDDQHKQKARTISVDRVETKEELERLERFKKDAGEDYLVVHNQEQLKEKEKKQKPPFYSTSEVPSFSSGFTEPSIEDVDIMLSPERSPLSKTELQEVEDDEESGRIFLVSVKPRQHTEESDNELDDIFVTVKGHELVEKNIHLKETSRLDLKGLLDVGMTSDNDKTTVVLKFAHVHKERKYREYTMDDKGQCEKFASLLKEFVKEPDSEDTVLYKQFKCLKCSKNYTTLEEITLCAKCGEAFVVEVTEDNLTKLAQNKTTASRTETDAQDPDLITSTVRHAPVQPDICIAGNETDANTKITKTIDENSSERNSEYSALVSTIHVKPKDTSHEENEDYEPSDHTSTQNSFQGQNSTSAAMNISLDGMSASRRRYYNTLWTGSVSPIASSYSSQSGSESRNSTPVGGKTSSQMHFSLDSCTHCDHRLKLYLETKLFQGGEDEEFCCIIKCPVASYGQAKGVNSLLVISNKIAYICKITGFESTRPKEWLSIKVCYFLTDLRYIEYGLQSQSFRLEFAEQFGCHTFLVGDRKRCEDFLTTLRIAAKKACGGTHRPARIGKANPQTLANIRIQVFGVKDESLMFKGRRLYEQAVNFTDPPLLKDRKVWFRTLPESMLGEEFIDWLISRKEASSYREAVYTGQLLLNGGIIKCFDKDCGFLEHDQYYYFNLPEELRKDETRNQNNIAESAEVNTTIKHYILAQWKDEEKSKPISMIITNTDIALAEENHQWPLPRLHDPPNILTGPQFVLKRKQKIININDVELFVDSPGEIEIEFQDEDTPESIEDDRWHIVLQTENSLSACLDAIKEIWEDKFVIDLPINIRNKME